MEWKEFSHITSSNQLEEYFKDRSYTHSNNCHYTKVDTIDKILSSSFKISCVNKFNDECDKSQFGTDEEQRYYFALCFSNGTTENLALWYLYSGVDGKGGRINISKKDIENIVTNSKYELYEIDSSNKTVGMGLPLNDQTMTISFKDVVYYEEQEQYVRLKYNTMVNKNLISIDEFNKFKERNKGFYKDIIWYYEKESRLLIELKGEAKNIIKKDKKYCIQMTLPNPLSQNCKIEFAPEIDDNEYWSIVNKYERIQQFLYDTSNLKKSKHSGKVKMRLCNNFNLKCIKECDDRKKE